MRWLVSILVAIMWTMGAREAAAQVPGYPDHARVLPKSRARPAPPEVEAEWPGHRGPVLGVGMVFGNTLGAEAFIGWAWRWFAPALWARLAINTNLDVHQITGIALRAWNPGIPRRLYFEGRVGYDELALGVLETPEDEVGPSHPGIAFGATAGYELASFPAFTFDVRAGVDVAVIEDAPTDTFFWLGLAMTVY